MLTLPAGCCHALRLEKNKIALLRRKKEELLSKSGVQFTGVKQREFARAGSVTASGKLEPIIILLIVC